MAIPVKQSLLQAFETGDKPTAQDYALFIASVFAGAESVSGIDPELFLDNTQGKFYESLHSYDIEIDVASVVLGGKAHFFCQGTAPLTLISNGFELIGLEEANTLKSPTDANFFTIEAVTPDSGIVTFRGAPTPTGKVVIVNVASNTPDSALDLNTYLSGDRFEGGQVNFIVASAGKTIILPDLAAWKANGELQINIFWVGNPPAPTPVVYLQSHGGNSFYRDDTLLSTYGGWTWQIVGRLAFSDYWTTLRIKAVGKQSWTTMSHLSARMVVTSPFTGPALLGRVPANAGLPQPLSAIQVLEMLIVSFAAAATGKPLVTGANNTVMVGEFPSAGGLTAQTAKTLFGNYSASAAVPAVLTRAQARDLLGFVGLNSGTTDMVPIVGPTTDEYELISRRKIADFKEFTLTMAGSLAWNWVTNGDRAALVMTGHCQITDIAGMTAGQCVSVEVQIGAGGANKILTLFPSTGYTIPAGQGWPVDVEVGQVYDVSITKQSSAFAKPWDVIIYAKEVVPSNGAPVVTPTLVGTANVGNTITGNYTYTDSDTEGATEYSLRRHATGTAVFASGTVITSGLASADFPDFEYVLAGADLGSDVILWMRGIAVSGTLVGEWTQSNAIGAVAASLPTTPTLEFLASQFLAVQNTYSATPWTYVPANITLNYGASSANKIGLACVSYTRTGAASPGQELTGLTINGVAWSIISQDIRLGGDQVAVAIVQCPLGACPVSGTYSVQAQFNFTPQDVRIEHFMMASATPVASGSVPASVYDWNGGFATLAFANLTVAGAGMVFQYLIVEGWSLSVTAQDSQVLNRSGSSVGLTNGTFTKYVGAAGSVPVKLNGNSTSGAGIALFFRAQ